MRTRRAFSPVLESLPTLALQGHFINPVSAVTVPSDPPSSFVNPVNPVTVPVPPTPYSPPYTGPDAPTPTNPAPTVC